MIKQTFAVILLSLLTGLCTFGQSAKHVILISIDGFRPEFYKDSQWPAPNLQQMMTQGVYADAVRSVFPSVTYPSHTTMITGAMPGRHGIFNNKPFEPKDQSGAWYYYEKAIQVKTLWDAAREANRTTAAVIWPVSVGAPIDYNIPVIRPVNNKNATQLSLTREAATPAGLLKEIELNATGKLRPEIYNNDYFIMDENISRMATYLIEQYKPALTAVHFISVDHVAHATGKDSDKVKQAVGLVDRAVGSIIEAVKRAGIEESTAIIVTGDHGFVDTNTRMNPNIWLADAGIINKVKEGKWKAQFQSAGGSALLYLKDKNDKKTLKAVEKILKDLPETQKEYFNVIDRTALDKIGADPDIALALAGKKGVVFGSATEGQQVRPVAKGGSHGYFPDFSEIHTGFVAWGAGFNKGSKISLMGVEDIAPLIAELLDIPFEAPDGDLHHELLK